MEQQHTIAKPVSLQGRGLFFGRPANLTFKPAEPDRGIVFVRTDADRMEVPALIQHVVRKPRRSALKNGPAEVEVVEHLLSAVAGLRLDNLLIEIDAAEVPILDGSSKPYIDALLEAQITPQDKPRKRLVISEPVVVRDGDSMVAAMPCDDPELQLLYEMDYGQAGPIRRQFRQFDLANGDYANEIAPCRTYVLESEAIELRDSGMGAHLTPDDVLVIGREGKPLGDNRLRFEDEPLRHKILDLIGDLYLLGAPIQGRVVAYKSGHSLNHELVRQLVRQYLSRTRRDMAIHRTALDVRQINKLLPHRYPMLLIDRVLEIEGDQRIIGVKNVSINEPFFQGHYPSSPIMPGVLIVEAMAQLSGLLIGQKVENVGKLAVLLSLDKVKLRKPVTPGDQLVMEAESLRVRSRIAHMRCRAFVAEELAAEAEVKFMLVDDDQE